MRNIFCYDYQISYPHVCNRTCHRLRCSSSTAHPERIAHRITVTDGESCIAFTRRVASGFAESKTHSQESESGDKTASCCKPSARRAHNRKSDKPAGAGRRSWLGMGQYRGRRLPRATFAFLRHNAEGQIHDRAGRNSSGIQTRAQGAIEELPYLRRSQKRN
jgi:hypothetical protein